MALLPVAATSYPEWSLDWLSQIRINVLVMWTLYRPRAERRRLLALLATLRTMTLQPGEMFTSGIPSLCAGWWLELPVKRQKVRKTFPPQKKNEQIKNIPSNVLLLLNLSWFNILKCQVSVSICDLNHKSTVEDLEFVLVWSPEQSWISWSSAYFVSLNVV